jgi:signal transduction histidine kinase
MLRNLKQFFARLIPESLVGKMTALNIGVIMVLAVIMTAYIDQTIDHSLRLEHKLKGMAYVAVLVADVPGFILSRDYAGLQTLVNNTIKGDPDLRYAYVVDPSCDKVLAHTFTGGFPADLQKALRNHKFSCQMGKAGSTLLSTEEGEIMDIQSPVLGGEAGCVHIGMSLAGVNRTITDMKLQLLAVILALAILTLLINFVYSRKLGRNMTRLAAGAAKIGHGNLEHRITLTSRSELGLLAHTLNQMAESLQENIRQRQRDAEDLARLEKLESIGDLAAGIAHDYNNLHTAVLGNLDLAKYTADPKDKAYNFLCQAADALRQEMRLTNKLLTFARGGAPIREVVNVRDFLTSTCPACLKASSCRLQLDLPETLPATRMDSRQIGQVLENLLQNAIEAMPEGGTITLAAREVTMAEQTNPPMPPGRYIKITVADHGAGIDDKIIHRIFNPYFSTKDRGAKKGQGIGLSVCRSIIAKHGGSLNCQTNPTGGMSFHFYLRAEHEEAAI